MLEETRQKRNKPCENCRSYRRKCVMLDSTICERCSKLNLACTVKIMEKPVQIQPPAVSITKQETLLTSIWLLTEEFNQTKFQLTQLKSKLDSNKSCQCIDPTQCTHNLKLLPSKQESRWDLQITSNKNGSFHVQTTIQSMSDLSSFVKEAFAVFKQSGFVDTTPSSNKFFHDYIPVTNKVLKIETAVRSLIGTLGSTMVHHNLHQLAMAITRKNNMRTRLKVEILKKYFNCSGLMNPVMVKAYYLPRLVENPDSLIATSVVAMAAYTKCQHISVLGYPFTRSQFAESCRLEAMAMLREMLFESEASLEISIALYFLSTSSTFASKGKEARLQSSICWNMLIQLKPHFLAKKTAKRTNEEIILTETFIRLFYAARYSEFNFHITFDRCTAFEGMVHDTDVRLPALLPEETAEPHVKSGVLCYRYMAQLTTNAAGASRDGEAELTGLKLFAGVVDEVSVATIYYLESSTLQLWDDLPKIHRIGYGPFRYMDDNEIVDCTDPCIIRFNMIFYVYWINLQSRVMRMPQATDLTGAAFGKMDGDRALIITSICTDSATKIFAALQKSSPCILKLHWLALCIEVLKSLSSCADRSTRTRAVKNLRILIEVLRLQLEYIGTELAPALSALYFISFKKIIASYMADAQKITL